MMTFPFSMDELEGLANRNEKRLAKMQEVAETLPLLEGVGYAADDRIKATVKDGAHLSGLTLDPRVMRMDSATLADQIVEAVRSAAADLQEQITEKMSSVSDESPFDLLRDAEGAQAKFSEIQAGFQQSMDEIMNRVERIRRNLSD